jgi:hypothetical protein
MKWRKARKPRNSCCARTLPVSRAAAGSTLDPAVRAFTYTLISASEGDEMLEHSLLNTLVRTELIECVSSFAA